jgi:hypothetical protein
VNVVTDLPVLSSKPALLCIAALLCLACIPVSLAIPEAPANQTFSSEKEEIAYYDSLNEDAFMSVAETEELFGKWKN